MELKLLIELLLMSRWLKVKKAVKVENGVMKLMVAIDTANIVMEVVVWNFLLTSLN